MHLKSTHILLLLTITGLCLTLATAVVPKDANRPLAELSNLFDKTASKVSALKDQNVNMLAQGFHLLRVQADKNKGPTKMIESPRKLVKTLTQPAQQDGFYLGSIEHSFLDIDNTLEKKKQNAPMKNEADDLMKKVWVGMIEEKNTPLKAAPKRFFGSDVKELKQQRINAGTPHHAIIKTAFPESLKKAIHPPVALKRGLVKKDLAKKEIVLKKELVAPSAKATEELAKETGIRGGLKVIILGTLTILALLAGMKVMQKLRKREGKPEKLEEETVPINQEPLVEN